MKKAFLVILLASFLASCQFGESKNLANTKGNSDLARAFEELSKQAYQDSLIVFNLDSLTIFEWDTVLVITPYTPTELIQKQSNWELEPIKFTRVRVTEGYNVLAFFRKKRLIDFVQLAGSCGTFESFEGTRYYMPTNATFRMFRSGNFFSDSTEILSIQPLDTTKNLISWRRIDQGIAKTQNRKFEHPIMLDSIKNKDNVEFTSGVETADCDLERNGFFGSYNLIDMEAQEPFAKLVVFTTDQPEKWQADSKNEQFVSVEVFSQDLVIWDSLYVGLSLNQLKKFIQGQFHYQKGQTVYSDFERYEGIFKIRDDSITSFEIKTKCDSIW